MMSSQQSSSPSTLKTMTTEPLHTLQHNPDGSIRVMERARHEVGPSETGMYSVSLVTKPLPPVGNPGEIETRVLYYLTAAQLERLFVLADELGDAAERRV